ncbi:MAG TPA: MarR family transcriptional regulator [Verrucomicrobiae bacterium]|jgi:DNA-binding MarR family transcriptional regulator|nr:MarR family transcriptional regulator [Verrucomicrobiae bacterium]
MASRERQISLEQLLAEAGALANRLKKAARAVHSPAKIPVEGKNILQSLAENGPRTVSQMARERSSSRQSIQMLVNKLVAGGWVEFEENPAHKSSRLVQLTTPGRELLEVVSEREAGFFAPLLNGVTGEEIFSTTEILARLRALLEGRKPSPIKVKTHPRVISRPPRAAKHPAPIAAKKVEPPPVVPDAADDDSLPVNLL